MRGASVATLLLFCAGGFAFAEETRVKRIAQRYEQIEAQTERAVHFIKRSEDGGTSVTDQAWLTEARDYLKVASDRREKGGRELTEMFFENGHEPMMVLGRAETPLGDGATRVDETRSYFEEGTLFRRLRKSATFPPGAPLETGTTKNVPVNVGKLPEKERDGQPFAERAATIMEKLVAAGPPECNPSAGSPGDSARFRLIQRTTSPDGRFALGLGTAKQPVPWDQLEDSFDDGTGYRHYTADLDDASVKNYVINLSTHRILSESGCQYFGTRYHYNHHSSAASWSPRSRFLVQTFDSKWRCEEAVAGWIDAEKGRAATTDLCNPATERAYRFLAARKDRAYRKHGREFAVSVRCREITDDGVIELDVTGEIPKSDQPDSTFRVYERFRIRRVGDKAELEYLNARQGPPL